MKRKLIWVRWVDASAVHCKWQSTDDTSALVELESAGLLIKQDETGVVFAADYSVEYDQWRDVSTIPHVNIIKKRIVTVDV